MTFDHASKPAARWRTSEAQKEVTGHVGVTFVEKMCPLGVCQVHLHSCSSGHGERSLSVKGTGTGLGAKTKALETEMCLGFSGSFHKATSKLYYLVFSSIMSTVGTVVIESEIFSLGETFFRLAL